ncbi:MAG: DUF4266 domain-containing protein [Deltaproteobacteria bacterium]|nr:DUF4266 domain-containing protein [Deltaproteobacteria bacterium]MBW2189502.1 DUF4266 domain-containing protein [Deltaproteobacteria bacterium]MBW2225127.1 DUF4266 domain-containing protein [Deltaproteobacteria bacterium]MBW2403784.1 DUF4266 domain-containing protein [Deltaproteobacteria bacterium]MBW2547253.1 DUF4266 domain-containing protein [Deltaproteobacteria bacterium]
MDANHHPTRSDPSRHPRAVRHHAKTRRKRLRHALKLAIVLALGTAAGCATVKPYEREYLARPSMDFEREATEARFYTHVLDAREGATGGLGTAGGGCGCN